MSNPKIKHQIGHGRIRANLTIPRGSGTALGGASVTVERRISDSGAFAPAATIRLDDLDAAIRVLTEMKRYIADPAAKPAKSAPASPAASAPAESAKAPTVSPAESPPFTPNVPKSAPVTQRRQPQTSRQRSKPPSPTAPTRRRQLAASGRSR
jgi:hypothetical protein